MGGEGFEPSKLSQQIYSLPPLATRESTHIMENDEMVFSFLRKGKNKPYFCVVIFLQSLIPVSRNKKKADDRTRTDNLLITSQLLCQLSHIGMCFALEPNARIILSQLFSFVKHFLKKNRQKFFPAGKVLYQPYFTVRFT